MGINMLLHTILSITLVCFTTAVNRRLPKRNLYGEPGDGYYLKLVIGQPPQTLNVLIDTGSSNFAVVGYPNNVTSRFYNPNASTSYSSSDVKFHLKYTEGEWSGHLATDQVEVPSLNDLHLSSANIAVIESASNFFVEDSNWDGILGLAYKAISLPKGSVTPFVDQLVFENKLNDSFCVQLCGTIDMEAEIASTGGYLSFGPPLTELYRGDMLYASLIKEDYYQVLVTDIQLEGASLGLKCTEYNNDKTIIDTGTTNLKLPSSVYKVLIERLKSVTNVSDAQFWSENGPAADSLCYAKGDASVFRLFPALSIHLMESSSTSMSVTISSQLYLREEESSSTQSCYRLAISESKYGTVIGAVFLEGYYVHFDREHHRVGFAVSSCSHCEPWEEASSSTCSPSRVSGGIATQSPSSCQSTPSHQTPLYVLIVAGIACAVAALCISIALCGFGRRWRRRVGRARGHHDIPFEALYDNEDEPH